MQDEQRKNLKPPVRLCLFDHIRISLETHGPHTILTNQWGLPHPDNKEQTLLCALEIYKQFRGNEIVTNYGTYAARVIAASIYYMASLLTNLPVGMREVGDAFDVSSNTVSKHFHRLKRYVNLNADEIQRYVPEERR